MKIWITGNMRQELTQEYVKSILDYNSETGIFAWKYRADKPKNWNSQYPSKIAGCINANGYHQIYIDGVLYLSHRLVWLYVYGSWPCKIDHADLDRANNKIDNLRNCTQSQNCSNARIRGNNTSGYKGVNKLPSGKWRAEIQFNKKRYRLGHFNCPTAAYVSYCKAANEIHGEFARLS